MDENEIDLYVRHALALSGYAFDAETEAAIAVEFRRIATIAEQLLEPALPLELEALTLFRP